MIFEWAATLPDQGRDTGVPTTTDGAEMLERINQLRETGSGYVEIGRADQPWLLLSLSFRGDHAVIHRWTDEETMALLGGDGDTESLGDWYEL